MYDQALQAIQRYVSRGIASAFVVHGNVYDLSPEGDASFIDALRAQSNVWVYDLSGLRGDVVTLRMQTGKDEVVSPAELVEAMNALIKGLTDRQTLVVDYGALMFGKTLAIDERTVMTHLLNWARDKEMTLVLVAENEGDLPRELRSPTYGFRSIRVDLPTEEVRREMLAEMGYLLEYTHGLRLRDIFNLIADGKIERAAFSREAARIVNQVYGGALKIVDPKRSFASLAGMRPIKALFSEVIALPPQEWPSGALFMGAAGLGKTIFAEALAGELECPLVIVSIGSLRDMYQGEGEKNMARTLAALDGFGRCVVLFDELDMQVGAGGTTQDQGMMQLLQSWLDGDGNNHRGRVFPIGTTNYPDRIPAALKRSGRLGDIKVLFMWPTRNERVDFWKLKGREADAEALADRTEQWTYAELDALNRKIARMGMERALETSVASTDELIAMSKAGAREITDLSTIPDEYLKLVKSWGAR